MELRTFIKTALLDIMGGVTDAQKEITSGHIVPDGINKSFKAVEHGISELQAVDFEVSVSAEETSGTEGKLGVVTAIIGAGISGKNTNESSNTSKLKFSIPIQLPKMGERNS
jgi:hypothetical protein